MSTEIKALLPPINEASVPAGYCLTAEQGVVLKVLSLKQSIRFH